MPNKRNVNLNGEGAFKMVRQGTLKSSNLGPNGTMSLENTDDTITEQLNPNSPSILLQKSPDRILSK